MKTDDQIFLSQARFVAVGVFLLGLVACEPKPVINETGGNSGSLLEQKSGAGNSHSDPDKVGQRVNDLSLNIKVEDALKENARLAPLKLKVRSVGGIVTLLGTSDSEENSKLATQIAMSVSGVKSVQNKLVVDG